MSAGTPAVEEGGQADRPLRVGLIAPPWVPVPPPRYGGTEAVLNALARGLQRAGHDVLLFTTGDAQCQVPRRSVHHRAPPPEMIGTTIAEVQHVQAAYEELADCDVIHDHTTIGPVWAATRRDRPPVVATNHGEFTGELQALYREVASWASVTAVSHSQRATARDVPVAAVIHHGLDPEEFPVGAGDGGYALFLGRFAPHKGAHRAIRIARRAGLPLRIAAKMREPAEREYFEQWIEPELGSDVTFLGEVGPDERNRLFGEAVALLNPIAWDEPFGMVMIEALACGTPVVAFRSGAAPEIVDHGVTGFLCRTVEEAADAVHAAAALPRAACRASVQQRFTADRMVADYLAVFGQLASRPGRGGEEAGAVPDQSQRHARQSARPEARQPVSEPRPGHRAVASRGLPRRVGYRDR